MTFLHLFYILLVGSKSQVTPILKGMNTGMNMEETGVTEVILESNT